MLLGFVGSDHCNVSWVAFLSQQRRAGSHHRSSLSDILQGNLKGQSRLCGETQFGVKNGKKLAGQHQSPYLHKDVDRDSGDPTLLSIKAASQLRFNSGERPMDWGVWQSMNTR